MSSNAPSITELTRLSLFVNQEPIELWAEPGETLSSLLRNRLRMTGTKQGCDHGECGACTVLLDGNPIYACMILAVQTRNRQVTTIEGIQAKDGGYHAMQQAFIEADAIQCGFCTSGMLLTSIALLEQNPQPTVEEIRHALAGNLCRCAGYQRIIEAIQKVIAQQPRDKSPS